MARLSRDEIVARGDDAARRGSATHEPWIYYAKIKSGRRATQNKTGEYYSIPHLNGMMVAEHATEGETFNVYGITRVMRSQMRSMREDI